MVVYKVITNWDWFNSPQRSTVELVEETHDMLPHDICDTTNGYFEEFFESRSEALRVCIANQKQALDRGDFFTPIGW